jgi:pimeloyl-ACP methyl ester carboxylesterase
MNSAVPSAEMRPTVSSASPQMNRVGTLVGPIGWRSPRARFGALPGVGHYAADQVPEQVNALLLEHIARHPT